MYYRLWLGSGIRPPRTIPLGPNHLNFFDYLTDILDKTAKWQPNTPLRIIGTYCQTVGNPQQKNNRAEQVFLAQFFDNT